VIKLIAEFVESSTPLKEIVIDGSKATVAVFAPLSDYILTGHESGKVAKYDVKTGEEVNAIDDAHRGEITDIQLSPDGTYFITSSKDKTARVSLRLLLHLLRWLSGGVRLTYL